MLATANTTRENELPNAANALPFQFVYEEQVTEETWSGMGGRMNRTNKKRESGRRTRKATASRDEAGSGSVSVKETANFTVVNNSKEIADSLLKCALTGDVQSAKLLLSLSDGAACGDDSRTDEAKVSIASVWEAEPQWQGEVSESSAESESGSREPEF